MLDGSIILYCYCLSLWTAHFRCRIITRKNARTNMPKRGIEPKSMLSMSMSRSSARGEKEIPIANTIANPANAPPMITTKSRMAFTANSPAERPASSHVKNPDVAKTFVNCAYVGTMRIMLGKTRSSNANSTKQWMS